MHGIKIQIIQSLNALYVANQWKTTLGSAPDHVWKLIRCKTSKQLKTIINLKLWS